MHKMTYTVTKTYTKQNDATFWPWEREGYAGGLDGLKSTGKLTSSTSSEDGNTCIHTHKWASKSDWYESMNRSASIHTSVSPMSNTYMSLNNISCRIVEEDGTVFVFNSSTQAFEKE